MEIVDQGEICGMRGCVVRSHSRQKRELSSESPLIPKSSLMEQIMQSFNLGVRFLGDPQVIQDSSP
jgi:hypothetical protein